MGSHSGLESQPNRPTPEYKDADQRPDIAEEHADTEDDVVDSYQDGKADQVEAAEADDAKGKDTEDDGVPDQVDAEPERTPTLVERPEYVPERPRREASKAGGLVNPASSSRSSTPQCAGPWYCRDARPTEGAMMVSKVKATPCVHQWQIQPATGGPNHPAPVPSVGHGDVQERAGGGGGLQ